MLEITVPAFSPEAVCAAVQNGASSVYLDFGGFGSQDFKEAVLYCRMRCVKVYFAIERFYTDSDFSEGIALAGRALSLGVTAVEVCDLGLLRTLRKMYPSAKLHLGMNAGIHNAAGAATAAYLGADRIILSPHLSYSELASIAEAAHVELEFPCHGPVCTAAPGTCRMSAFTGHSAACFTACSEPCRRTYGIASKADGFNLSLRDICLAGKIPMLSKLGITAIRILGKNRRPEYSALTSKIYSDAVSGIQPDSQTVSMLEKAFSPSGMSSGFFSSENAPSLFGRQDDKPRHPQALLSGVSGRYSLAEAKLVPVKVLAYIRSGEPLMVGIIGRDGTAVRAYGSLPEPSAGSEVSPAMIKTQISNLGSCPYFCEEAVVSLERGYTVSPEELLKVKQEAISLFAQKLCEFAAPVENAFSDTVRPLENSQPPEINLLVYSASQLSAELAGLLPSVLYVPIQELIRQPQSITPFWENGKTVICAVLPPVINDGSDAQLYKSLDFLKSIHIGEVLISNIGHILPALAKGFSVRADFGTNAYNSQSIRALKELKISSVVLPPELSFSGMKAICKHLPAEAVVYGRIPLMTSGVCITRGAAGICSCGREARLRSRRSAFPVIRQYKCRSTLFSSEKLFLASNSKQRDYESLGLSSVRLDFTTENAAECVSVFQRYLRQNRYEPSAKTKGLYYN